MNRNTTDIKYFGSADVLCPAVKSVTMSGMVRVRGDLQVLRTGNRTVHGRDNLGSGVI